MKNIAKALAQGPFLKTSPLHPLKERATVFPDSGEIVEAVIKLKNIMLPSADVHSKTKAALENYIEETLKQAEILIAKNIKLANCLFCNCGRHCRQCETKAQIITSKFIKELPKVQKLILSDIKAAYEGDPACKSIYEAMASIPGVKAIFYYRLAHILYGLGVETVPRIITEYAHSITGADIHPGAKIGHSFFIDHGTGVVIGETSVIGNHVKIYQGVTLGAKSIPLDKSGRAIKGIKRHPNVGNNVTIYANATILGNIKIAAGVIIGGNQWITKDVEKKHALRK